MFKELKFSQKIIVSHSFSFPLMYSQSTFSSLFLFCKLHFLRFAAQKRSAPINYLPTGDITDYDELIDVGNNFNPSTGVFTVGNKEEHEGTYVFLFSGRKSDAKGKEGLIKFYKNGDYVQSNVESDASNSLQMNSIVPFNLKKGDEIKLKNDYDDSIYVTSNEPFTFTGYKI